MAHNSPEGLRALATLRSLFIAAVPRAVEVRITYNGSGDSGQIDDVTALDAEGNELPLSDEFRDEARPPADSLTEIWHPGWENNEGASGVITLNLIDSTLTLEHTDNIDVATGETDSDGYEVYETQEGDTQTHTLSLE